MGLTFYLSIDWVFLSIDTLGGLFSLFALGTYTLDARKERSYF